MGRETDVLFCKNNAMSGILPSLLSIRSRHFSINVDWWNVERASINISMRSLLSLGGYSSPQSPSCEDQHQNSAKQKYFPSPPDHILSTCVEWMCGWYYGCAHRRHSLPLRCFFSTIMLSLNVLTSHNQHFNSCNL